MKIIVDAFGGDKAPLEILKGTRDAVAEYGVEIILTGNAEKIKKVAAENNISLEKMEIVEAETVISMDDEPMEIIKSHKNSSMAVGLRLLSEGVGDAFVSAGSTGALTVGGTMIVKRINGIKRAAIGAHIPNRYNGYLMVDTGANEECRPDMLLQFAIMGNAYMSKIEGRDRPKIGLLNIGTEPTKGLELQKKTYKILSETSMNFIGNVEGGDLPMGKCDVVVADGFNGNVALKTTEGMGKLFSALLKDELFTGISGKLAGFILLGALKRLKKRMNPSEFGGAPLLGLKKPVIKAHGSSSAFAFKNAIRQAIKCVDKDVCGEIARTAEHYKNHAAADEE